MSVSGHAFSHCSVALACAEAVLYAVQAGAITGFVSAFAEGPIDFFKSQIQVQIIRSRSDPNYKRVQYSFPLNLVLKLLISVPHLGECCSCTCTSSNLYRISFHVTRQRHEITQTQTQRSVV